MSTSTVDYDSLAKKYGAVSSAPSVDYDALAKQHGAVSSVPSDAMSRVDALGKQAQAAQSRDRSAGRVARAEDSTLGGLARIPANLLGMAKATVTAPFTDPTTGATTAPSVENAIGNMVVRPSLESIQHVGDVAEKHGMANTKTEKAGKVLASVPFVGPWVMGTEGNPGLAERKSAGGILTEGIGTLAAGELAPKVIPPMLRKGVEKGGELVHNIADSRPAALAGEAVHGIKTAWNPEKNLSPIQAATKAFRPRNSKMNWKTELQTALPDAKRALDKMSVDQEHMTLDDALSAAGQAKKDVWQEYTNRFLDPAEAAKATVNGDAVAGAMRSTITPRMRAQNPNLAASIEAKAATYDGKRLTIPEAQQFLTEVNNETRGVEAKYLTDKKAAKRDPANAYQFAERDTLRLQLDKTLETAAGEGGAELRKRWGALSSLEDTISRRIPVADRRSVVPLTRIFQMLEGPGRIVRGLTGGGPADVAMGVFNTKQMANAEKMSSPEWLTQQAFRKTQAAPPAAEYLSGEYMPMSGDYSAIVPGFLRKQLPSASRIYGTPEESAQQYDLTPQNKQYGDSVTPLAGNMGALIRNKGLLPPAPPEVTNSVIPQPMRPKRATTAPAKYAKLFDVYESLPVNERPTMAGGAARVGKLGAVKDFTANPTLLEKYGDVPVYVGHNLPPNVLAAAGGGSIEINLNVDRVRSKLLVTRPEEFDGILAHELAHVAREQRGRDMGSYATPYNDRVYEKSANRFRDHITAESKRLKNAPQAPESAPAKSEPRTALGTQGTQEGAVAAQGDGILDLAARTELAKKVTPNATPEQIAADHEAQLKQTHALKAGVQQDYPRAEFQPPDLSAPRVESQAMTPKKGAGDKGAQTPEVKPAGADSEALAPIASRYEIELREDPTTTPKSYAIMLPPGKPTYGSQVLHPQARYAHRFRSPEEAYKWISENQDYIERLITDHDAEISRVMAGAYSNNPAERAKAEAKGLGALPKKATSDLSAPKPEGAKKQETGAGGKTVAELNDEIMRLERAQNTFHDQHGHYDRGMAQQIQALNDELSEAFDRENAPSSSSDVSTEKQNEPAKKAAKSPGYLDEQINYGGELRSRGSVIAEMQKDGVPQKQIDAYMMGANLAKEIAAKSPAGVKPGFLKTGKRRSK